MHNKLFAAFGLPSWVDLGLRTDTVLAALALSVLAAAVAGVLPALRATGRGVQANLQHSAAGKGSVRFGLGSSLLMVSQIVLSVGFLALGGVMVRNVFRNSTGRLGLEPERYLRAELRVPLAHAVRQPETEDDEAFRTRVAQTQKEVLRRLAEDEAVRGVGMGVDRLATYDPGDHDTVLEGREAEGVTWEAVVTGWTLASSEASVGPSSRDVTSARPTSSRCRETALSP